MAEALDVTIPLSSLDRAVCDAVSKLSLAVELDSKVARAEMDTVCRGLWQAVERDRQRRAEQLLASEPALPRDDFATFRRRLATLNELGARLLAEAGVLDPEDAVAFAWFDSRPFTFLLELSPARFKALFELIREREEESA